MSHKTPPRQCRLSTPSCRISRALVGERFLWSWSFCACLVREKQSWYVRNSLRRCPVLPVWAEPAAWQKRTETRQQDVRTVLKKQVQKQPAAAGGKSGQQPGPENLLRTKAAEKQRQRQRQRDTQRDKTTPNPQPHLVLPPPQPAGQQEHPALHLNVVVYQYVRSCAGDRKRRYVLETRARAGYY